MSFLTNWFSSSCIESTQFSSWRASSTFFGSNWARQQWYVTWLARSVFPFLRWRLSFRDPMMLLSGWFLTTLDYGFFEVDISSFWEIGGWTSGGVRGLGDLDNDLVSILEFTRIDSLSGECSSTSTSWASI